MNKKLLAVAIAGAMTVPMAAQAVKYKLSGQVNRAIVFMDDGEQSGVHHVDSANSNSRIRLKGSEDLGNGMKVGFYMENNITSNSSAGQTPEMNGDGGGDAVVGMRQSNVWFSGNWGKVTVGQTAGAADGNTEAFGTLFAGQYRTSFTASMAWRTSGGASIGLVESSTHAAYDGVGGRHDVIRYDAPKLGPVSLKASIGNDSWWEVGANVSADIGGGSLAINSGYGENSQGGVDNRWGASINYTFSQGTSIGGGYAENETAAGADSDTWTIHINHAWGNNTIGVNYSQSSDVTAGYDDEAWNIGFIHNIPKPNVQLYTGFLHTELDTPVGIATVEDHNTFVVGARVKFN